MRISINCGIFLRIYFNDWIIKSPSGYAIGIIKHGRNFTEIQNLFLPSLPGYQLCSTSLLNFDNLAVFSSMSCLSPELFLIIPYTFPKWFHQHLWIQLAPVCCQNPHLQHKPHAKFPIHTFLFFSWWEIASQCCIHFHCTRMWISHNYIHIPSLLSLPPACPHLSHHRAQAGLPVLE